MDRAAVVALPKAELHLHLELSMDPGLAEELRARSGLPRPARGPWPDQATFVRECEQVRDLVATLDDLARVAEGVVRAADAQGVWWTEVTCAPWNYAGRLGPAEEVLGAVLDGLERGCAATGRGAGVILAHNRAHPLELAWQALELCERHRAGEGGTAGVVALGLVGNEAGHPPAAFAPVFRAALDRQVNRVPHAGEGDGPTGIRSAWEDLRAQRIAHGVRAVEDAALVADLAAAGLCLDVCPTSNVMLAASPSLAGHQLPRLLSQGVRVSVGSDCSYLLGVDVVDEYLALVDQMGLGFDDLRAVARSSLVSSFAPSSLVRQAVAALDSPAPR